MTHEFKAAKCHYYVPQHWMFFQKTDMSHDREKLIAAWLHFKSLKHLPLSVTTLQRGKFERGDKKLIFNFKVATKFIFAFFS